MNELCLKFKSLVNDENISGLVKIKAKGSYVVCLLLAMGNVNPLCSHSQSVVHGNLEFLSSLQGFLEGRVQELGGPGRMGSSAPLVTTVAFTMETCSSSSCAVCGKGVSWRSRRGPEST